MTEAGEALLARLNPVFEGLRSAVDAINGLSDNPTGTLGLTAPARIKQDEVAARAVRLRPPSDKQPTASRKNATHASVENDAVAQ